MLLNQGALLAAPLALLCLPFILTNLVWDGSIHTVRVRTPGQFEQFTRLAQGATKIGDLMLGAHSTASYVASNISGLQG